MPIALLQHASSGNTRFALALRITRDDGMVYGFTSARGGATIDGVRYDPTHGLDASAITSSAGFAVDNLEMTVADGGTVFRSQDVEAGLWLSATFLFFRYRWDSAASGIQPLVAGIFGNVSRRRGQTVIELRGLQQYLQQSIGSVTSRTCRARFADFPAPNGTNRCRLVAASFTRTGTISAVASNQTFTSSGLWTAQPTEDYYGEGLLTWTGGANTGARQKVRSYATGGVITLMLPMAATVEVGDTFAIIAGCRKRLEEDCKLKFSNVLNFAGEPHLPGGDKLLNVPEINV